MLKNGYLRNKYKLTTLAYLFQRVINNIKNKIISMKRLIKLKKNWIEHILKKIL